MSSRSQVSEGAASDTLSVAICQLTSVDDLEANAKTILTLLQRLESQPPDLICFPENALFLRIKEETSIPGIPIDHPVLRSLSSWAKSHGSVVHLGSVPLLHDGRFYNSSITLRPSGEIVDQYRKIHLFDVDVEGQRPQRESQTFARGEEPNVFSINGWKLGSAICYDLRFAELFLRYAREGVDALLLPAAFLVPTGQAHWEILLRARAIECQAYVLAAAQGGQHRGVNGGTRSTYGHSMIVDPWGAIVASCPDGASDEQRILRAVLNRGAIAKVRAQIPMKTHRRLS